MYSKSPKSYKYMDIRHLSDMYTPCECRICTSLKIPENAQRPADLLSATKSRPDISTVPLTVSSGFQKRQLLPSQDMMSVQPRVKKARLLFA